MNRKLFFSVAFIVLLVACGKDSFQTKPQIKIKSMNGNVIPGGGTLSVNLTFTDKEGDLGDGKLVYIPRRLNRRPLPPAIPAYDSVVNILPKFPSKSLGEIQVSLGYNYLHKSDIENDTISLRFVAVDKAGHKSDTVTSDRIVILKN